MVKIRLSRKGARNKPFYHVVAVDEHAKRDGKALAVLGIWQPSKDLVKIDKEAITAWVAKGAKITESVEKLISKIA